MRNVAAEVSTLQDASCLLNGCLSNQHTSALNPSQLTAAAARGWVSQCHCTRPRPFLIYHAWLQAPAAAAATARRIR